MQAAIEMSVPSGTGSGACAVAQRPVVSLTSWPVEADIDQRSCAPPMVPHACPVSGCASRGSGAAALGRRGGGAAAAAAHAIAAAAAIVKKCIRVSDATRGPDNSATLRR